MTIYSRFLHKGAFRHALVSDHFPELLSANVALDIFQNLSSQPPSKISRKEPM